MDIELRKVDLLIPVIIYLTSFSMLIVIHHVKCRLRARAALLDRYKHETMQRQRQAFLRASI